MGTIHWEHAQGTLTQFLLISMLGDICNGLCLWCVTPINNASYYKQHKLKPERNRGCLQAEFYHVLVSLCTNMYISLPMQ